MSFEIAQYLQQNIYSDFLSDSHFAVYCINDDGTFKYVNNNFCDLFGYDYDEIYHFNFFDIIHPDDILTVHHRIRKVQFDPADKVRYQLRGVKKDQTIIYLEVLGHIFRENKGVVDVSGVMLENKEEETSKTFKRLNDFKFALDASATVSITDPDGIITYVNDTFCEVSKYTRKELYGKTHGIVNSGFHPKEYFQKMWETVSNGEVWNGEVRNRSKDGEIWWSNATIVPFLDENKNPYQYIAIRSDITNQKRLEEDLRRQEKIVDHLAYFDTLTGLPNRKLFDEEINKKFEEARTKQAIFGILFFDIDEFKFVNETLGYEIGDKLLREVAKRLNHSRREIDFISRYGGDEFTILLSNLRKENEIHSIAKRFLSLFEHPFLIDHYELYLTTSIGISLYPSGGDSKDALIQNADAALNRAKDEGKNKYEIYSPTMNVGQYKRFTLKNDLRKAVQDNEMFLHYQPKIDCKTNKIVGVEALVRWEHPEWGIVDPEEFIVLAERSGLINIIGEQVLFEACQQNKKWQDEGYSPIKIAVNFSAVQFLQSDMIEMVDNVLSDTGLDSKWLEIEITETAIIKNETVTLSKIEQLKERGISIAIDDYGKGFSSLDYLKRIKPNTLKIDQSFIQGIPADLEDSEIVNAVIKLAQKLKIRVVAEGIEQMDQVSYLRKIHCDELQGYLFSRPINADEFTKLLKQGICRPKAAIDIDEIAYENRREFFRIELPNPLIADMTITSVAGKFVELGKTKVLVEDIGPGGVRYTSNIKLPIRPDLILKITTCILGESIDFSGSIVWWVGVDNLHQYGLRFNISDKERESLITLLNQFQVQQRNNPAPSESSILKTSRNSFFKAIH